MGSRIEVARKARGLSRAAVVEAVQKLGGKVNPRNYANWLSGDKKPSLKNLEKLAQVLDVSVDSLLGHSGQEIPEPEESQLARIEQKLDLILGQLARVPKRKKARTEPGSNFIPSRSKPESERRRAKAGPSADASLAE